MIHLSREIEPLIDAMIEEDAEQIRRFLEATGQLEKARRIARAIGGELADFNHAEVYVQLIAFRVMQRLAQKSRRAATMALHKMLEVMGVFDPPTIETEKVNKH